MRSEQGKQRQEAYKKEWKSKNMTSINVCFKKELVKDFKEACLKLDVKQSQIFKEAILKTIEQAKEQ